MKVKSLVILVICILFISSCSSPIDVENTPSPSPLSSPQPSPTATPDYTEARANAKKLIWLTDDIYTAGVDPQIFIELNNMLLEKGADFIVEFVGIDTYDIGVMGYSELIREMKGKGDQVDVLQTGYGETRVDYDTFPEAVKDGLLEPLDEFLKTEDGQSLYNAFDEKAWESVKIGNKIYGISNRHNLASSYYLMINKEVQNKFNIQLPEKIDKISQLEPAFELIAESQNTKGESKNIIILDDYLSLVKNMIDCVYMNSGIAVKYDDKGSPLAFNIFEDPKFISLIDLAYDYIDRGFMRIGVSDSVYRGLFFATIYRIGELDIFYDGKLLLDKIVNIAPYKLSTGYLNTQKNGVDGVASWSENKEEAFKLLSMINTDSDLSNLLRYGILGKHYELVDGDIMWLDAEFRPPGYFSPANKMITHPIGLEPSNKTEAYRELHSSLKMSPTAGFILDKSNISDDLLTIRGIYEKYETIYTGKVKNYREELDKANKELKEANLDMVIDEINTQLTSWWTEKESEEQSIEKGQ